MTRTVKLSGEWTAAVRQYMYAMKLAGNSDVTITNHKYSARRFAEMLTQRGWNTPAEVPADGLIFWYLDQEWAPSTRRCYRAILRAFFAAQVDAGQLMHNPAERLPKAPGGAHRPRPARDPLIAAAVLAADERTQLLIELMAYIGLRRAEAAQVRREDVQGGPGTYELRVLGKGLKLRILPLSDYLGDKLLSCPPGYIFPSTNTGHDHIHVSRVNQLISTVLGEAGISPHMLRHRFATRVYAETKDIRAVQELLGHASVTTTQIYVGVSDAAMRSAAATAGSFQELPAAA